LEGLEQVSDWKGEEEASSFEKFEEQGLLI
jgi:hypothetical protein